MHLLVGEVLSFAWALWGALGTFWGALETLWGALGTFWGAREAAEKGHRINPYTPKKLSSQTPDHPPLAAILVHNT